MSVFLSLLLPLTKYTINIDLPHREIAPIGVLPIIYENLESEGYIEQPMIGESEVVTRTSFLEIMFALYFLGVVVFGIRLVFYLVLVMHLYTTSIKLKEEDIVLLVSSRVKNPFSFFKWVFIPDDLYEHAEYKDILIHEKIHASQYHSFDILLIELLSAVMWFNPFVWVMRKSVQLVHEYLADEGVLSTVIDKLEYQALLINQVAEERLISFSSGFNHSLIKKRMIMMTKSKFNRGSKLRIFALIPLAILLFVGVAFANGQGPGKNAKAFKVVIDAGHGGIDAGAKAEGVLNEKDLALTIAKMLKEKAVDDENIEIVVTCENDIFLPLIQRAAHDADLLISIHGNFSENTGLSGIECYVAKEAEHKVESERIGRLLMDELNQLNGIATKKSPIEANFHVLRESKCPAVLLNLGYLSNKNDLSFIADENNQGLICDKILNAINCLN